MLTDKVDDELLEAAGPSLRVVSTMSVGYEHVDLKAVGRRGLKLGYTPDVLTEAVADLCIMLALMASRVNNGVSIVQTGTWRDYSWKPFGFCGPQLSTTSPSQTRTVGFLGFGRIAQATLRRLVPFGITHVLYSGNPGSPPDSARDAALKAQHNLRELRKVDLKELARESDVLFVLAPGGPSTYHVVNREFLGEMKETAVLVNASRGTLVDSEALAEALGGERPRPFGAGLDVVEGEPNVGAEHPLVKEPRCVIVPHVASATFETRTAMATRAAYNLVGALFDELMPSSVDLSSFQ